MPQSGASGPWWSLAGRLLWITARLLRRLAGVRVTGLEQLPPSGPCVVVAPHVSLMDPILLYAALPRPPRFLTSAFYMSRNRLLGGILRAARVVPVRRDRPDVTAVRTALRVLAAGEVLAFFPEGGRSWTGAPFQPMTQAAKLLAGLRVPVFVAVLEGAYDLWPRWTRWPRPRRLSIRIAGPLDSPPRPSGTRAPAGRGRWWQAVFEPAPPTHVASTAAAVLAAFRAAAQAEPDRLRLRGRGRRRALGGLFGFCPQCAGDPLVWANGSLSCAACGTAWTVDGGARLISTRPGEPGEFPAVTVDLLFRRMAARLEARARDGLRLATPVAVAEVGPDGAGEGYRPGHATLGPEGLSVRTGSCDLALPLAAFARAQIEGAETLEIPAEGGRTVYVRGGSTALRLLLLGRAHLGLPLETMIL